MAERDRDFLPLYAVPPGETLEEVLEERQMTQSELARRMGRPFKTINEIIRGKAAIMPETAIQLERVLDVPASFWTNLESQYREDQARIREVESLADEAAWLDRFPLKNLKDLGHLPQTRDRAVLLHYVLRFFGVGNRRAWEEIWAQPQAAFRQSEALAASWEATSSWIRAGALEAAHTEASSFSKERFVSFLKQVRGMTRNDPEDFLEPLIEESRACGVVVVFLNPFKGVRAYGATHWITPSKAVIQLSNRYKTDDHLWFTFFHEAGHVVLHGHRRVFVEGKDVRSSANDEPEEAANEFASELLIPADDWNRFVEGHPSTHTSVTQFAIDQGVSAGIVVGRLQHEGLWPHTQGNGLKRRFTLVEGKS